MTVTLTTDLVRRFLALPDLTPFVADALDRLDVAPATVPAGVLIPLWEGERVVGPAVTLRYVPARRDASSARAAGEQPRLGDRAAMATASPGDLLVIDAGGNTSDAVVGDRVAARLADHGLAGCVCAGAVRDVDSIRAGGFPVWSAGRSPRNALHRLETAEVNGLVRVGECQVAAGDLVTADDNGVAFVPRALVHNVLALCEEQADQERSTCTTEPLTNEDTWSA